MIEEATGEPSIMLCLSREDRKLGSDFALSPEDLGAYACITLVMDGALACRILRESATYREVWVAAENEAEATRLAAGMKVDAPWRKVYLVQREPTASARERAREAGLDGVLSISDLVWRCETYDAQHEQTLESSALPALCPEGVSSCPVRAQVTSGSALPNVAAESMRPAAPLPPAAAPATPVVSTAPRLLEPSSAGPKLPQSSWATPMPSAPAAPTPMPPAPDAPMPTPPTPVASMPVPMPMPVPASTHSAIAAGLSAGGEAASAGVPPASADQTLKPAMPTVPYSAPPAVPPTYAQQPQGAVAARVPGSSGALISVVSGSGGSGKSTVAALLARQANRRGLRTALVDGDLQFGDLTTIAAAAVSVPLDELVSRGFPPMGFPQGEPVLFAAPVRLEAAELVVPQLEHVLQQLLAQFDVVVVNTGGNWGDAHALLLEKSMATVMLIDQRSSSVRACRHALDLCLRCGIATNAFVLTLNHCSRQGRFTSVDVSEVLDGARVTELSEGGAEVEEMMGSGLIEALVHGGNPLASSVDRLLGEMLPGLLASGQAAIGPAGTPGALALATPATAGRESRRRGGVSSPKKQRRSRKRSMAQQR